MKLRIDKTFKDKYNGKLYKEGSVVNFNADRAEELLADERGLVSKEAEEKAEDKPKEKPKKATASKKK